MSDEGKRDDASPESLEISKEGVARLLAMWQPVIEAVVDVVAGVQDAEDELEAFYAKLGAREDWQALPAVLRRVTGGERDVERLCEGLDVVDAVIVRGVLSALEAPHPTEIAPSPDDGDPMDGFLDLVSRALGDCAPAGLAERLLEAADQMAADEAEPAAVRAFGRAVAGILRGERDTDLSGLLPAHAARLRELC